MAKWYTNWVLIIGGLCIVAVVFFQMIPILNDTESLTNTQKLIKSIPTMAISILAVIFIMIKSLHYRNEKEDNEKNKELQEIANNLQKENNDLQSESNILREESIIQSKKLTKSEDAHTKEIREFGRLLNDNLENDLQTRGEIQSLTNAIAANELSRTEEIMLMKNDITGIKTLVKAHEDEHENLNLTISKIHNDLVNHLREHKKSKA